MRIHAILTKPLDGDSEGAEREFEQADFDMLERLGAVRRAVVADPVAAPSPALPTPPAQPEPTSAPAPAAPEPAEKQEPAVENKMADEPGNKAVRRARAKN